MLKPKKVIDFTCLLNIVSVVLIKKKNFLFVQIENKKKTKKKILNYKRKHQKTVNSSRVKIVNEIIFIFLNFCFVFILIYFFFIFYDFILIFS